MILPEVAHQMGAIPLATLLVLRLRKQRRDVTLWLLALGFLVSWVTDWGPHFGKPPAFVALLYPVVQAGIIFAALLPAEIAGSLIVLSGAAAILAILTHGVSGPEFLSRAVAWGAIVVIAVQRPALGWIAIALVVYFGIGLLAWASYVANPGWASWGTYQGARLVGLLTFSAATWRGAFEWRP